MLKISATDILQLRSTAGDRFTAFMDALIRAQAYTIPLAPERIQTNQQTNVRDGGVDTRVLDALHPTTDRLRYPTIWQYKAKDEAHISQAEAVKEINKPFSTRCLRENYAYRLCICSAVTPEKKQALEEKMTEAVRAISATAPLPQVLGIDDIAEWANCFPALIMQFFQSELRGAVLLLDVWGQNLTSQTPTYIPVNAWDQIVQKVKMHADFSKTPASIIFSIQGEAGVGKSRMTFEALRSIPGSDNIVLYASDDQSSKSVVRMLANDSSLKAILVVDDCSLQARLELAALASGHKHRIRIIAIDNSRERTTSGIPDYWLDKMSSQVLESILDANFPEIPRDRRQAYSRQSGGFVRFAAFLCIHNDEITAHGLAPGDIPDIRDYYSARLLPDDDREAIEAFSLFSKVGFKGDVQSDMVAMCSLLNLDTLKTIRIANRLHDASGFVGIAGRFMYVTPELVAQMALDGLATTRKAFSAGCRPISSNDLKKVSRVMEIRRCAPLWPITFAPGSLH
jgi:hypothetical protein